MDILLIVGDDIHEAALAQARAIGSVAAAGGHGALNAPLADDVLRWLDDIWDSAEAALLRARRDGRAAAQSFVDQVGKLVDDAAVALADRYQALRDALLARLNEYLGSVVDAALRLLRPTLTVGTQALPVRSVTVQQHLKLSGSIKASLQEIVAVVAEGQLSVTAEYAEARG